MPVLPKDAPRRYADFCYQNFMRWGVWDPARSNLKIGSYGLINADTGALDIEGNVYNPEFRTYIDECDGIKLANYPPVYSEEYVKPVMTSIWVQAKVFEAPPGAPAGVSAASTKRQWWFQKGRSCAVLLMHRPREQVLPEPVLEELFKAPQLKHKHLVTKVVYCSAYAHYLSGTDSEHITLSLKGSGQATSGTSDETRLGSNGGPRAVRRAISTRECARKDAPIPDPEPKDFWHTTFPSWQPLPGDDGIQVPIDDYEPEPDTTTDAKIRATDVAAA